MSGSMLGLISLGPQGDAEAQERRAELVPATTGEVLGGAIAEGFQESVGPRMARVVRRGYADAGDGNYTPLNAFDENEMPTGLLPPSPMVPLDVLKREYEIPGVLSFDKDTPQSVAQSLYEHKRDQMARADAVRRADNMLTQGMAARFVGSMIGSLADPVNIAAMFVPGLRESTVARMMGVGPGASALARAGVRAGAGASAGAAGMIALEPLNAALMAQERDDWTAAGALANVLFGTVAGAGFHSGLGALAERSRGLPEWAPARAFSEQMQNATPEVQEALVRSTMASTIEGRPVVAADLLELHTALEREAAALRGEAAAVPLHGLDEITVARIQDVEAALAETAITAERRATLEAELAMLTEGQNPEIVALERARSEAQRQGLETAAARTEARFAEVDRQLDEATRPGQAAPPPPAEGATVRLYRGEGAGNASATGEAAMRGSPMTGGWFTTNAEKAARYGEVKYVDVARDDLGSFAQGHGGVDEFVTDNPKFRAAAKPLESAPAAAPRVVVPDSAPLTTKPTTPAGERRAETLARKMEEMDALLARRWTADADAARLSLEHVLLGSVGKDGGLHPSAAAELRQRLDGWNSGVTSVARPRRPAEIMRDMEAAQRPNPADAMPPPATTRTGAAPPDPKPPGEIGAVAKDIAEIERQTAEMDALLKVQNDELLSARIKEYDALVDEEARVDTALFDAAAACIVRTR